MFNKKIDFDSVTASRPQPSDALISWPPLLSGTLLGRHKRFLAEIVLDSGETILAHCPNSGSMKTCCEPGRPVFVSIEDSPKRKLKYTWQLIRMSDSLVGVNTLVPNRLVRRAFSLGVILGFSDIVDVRAEVKVMQGARLDLLLTNSMGRQCYVEVKNCTLVEARMARFPDAVTQRGAKHLDALEMLVAEGHRCVMFYLVQRMDADGFGVADAIDPVYGRKFRHAMAAGVEVLAYDVRVDLTGIRLRRSLPILE